MTKKSISASSSWRQKLAIAVIFPYILMFFGLVGLSASIIINTEKVDLIRHPKTVLACDLNPVYSCGNVIDSKRSKTFGIANELIGTALFSGIFAVGLMVLAGSKPKKWFWQLFFAAMLAFSVATLALWHESVYVIGSLCIFCSTVWFSGWAITVGLFTWIYDQKYFAKAQKDVAEVLAYARKYNFGVWLGIMLVLVAFTLKHFWYYYGPKLGF